MITVETLNELTSLPNHQEGELAFVKSLNEVFKYDTDGWSPTEKNADISLSSYQLNKIAAASFKKLNKKEIAEAKNLIAEFTKDKYFMLLCRDLNYYTVFNIGAGTEVVSDSVIECLENLGKITNAAVTEDGLAIEFWFTNSAGEAFAAYYFNYTQGVIECL